MQPTLTPWDRCPVCGKIVKVNKPFVGSMHVCLSICQQRSHHSGPYFYHHREGWPWSRRDVYSCTDCGQTITLPLNFPVQVVKR